MEYSNIKMKIQRWTMTVFGWNDFLLDRVEWATPPKKVGKSMRIDSWTIYKLYTVAIDGSSVNGQRQQCGIYEVYHWWAGPDIWKINHFKDRHSRSSSLNWKIIRHYVLSEHPFDLQSAFGHFWTLCDFGGSSNEIKFVLFDEKSSFSCRSFTFDFSLNNCSSVSMSTQSFLKLSESKTHTDDDRIRIGQHCRNSNNRWIDIA